MSWQTEFPDFPHTDMPEIPEGFEDISWCNDACPNFVNRDLALSIFVDYADPEMREFPDTARFTIHRAEEDCVNVETLLETDKWDEVLTFLKEREP